MASKYPSCEHGHCSMLLISSIVCSFSVTTDWSVRSWLVVFLRLCLLERVQLVEAFGKSCFRWPSASIRQQHGDSERGPWKVCASLVVRIWQIGGESGLDRVGSSEIVSSMTENSSSGMRKSGVPLESSKPLLMPLESMWCWAPALGSNESGTEKDIGEAEKSSKLVFKAVNVDNHAESAGERRLGNISG